MRGRPAALAALCATVLLASACGTGGSSDLGTVASAIRTVEDRGASFTLTLTEIETGGDIPKGKMGETVYASTGTLGGDDAALVLGTRDPNTGRTTPDFDLVVADSDVFVRPHGSAREWYTTYTFAAEEFIPGVRLNLVRETVELATKVTKTTSFSGGAFLNQYQVTPPTEQLHQLMSFATAGTITASIAATSGHLQSLAFHFSGDDSASKRHLVVDATLSLSGLGKAAAPRVPAGAVAVQPADLFSTSQAGS